jgi:hypothetical protein
MASKAEQRIGRLLRAILANVPNSANIENAEHLQEVLVGLEFFIPEVLAELYPEWRHEGLDGVIPLVARKSAEREIEILGLCIIISDQTLTPIHLRLQVSTCTDEVSWLECQLGERGKHGMARMPYESLDRARNTLYALVGRHGSIEWVYKVTFGQRTK